MACFPGSATRHKPVWKVTGHRKEFIVRLWTHNYPIVNGIVALVQIYGPSPVKVRRLLHPPVLGSFQVMRESVTENTFFSYNSPEDLGIKIAIGSAVAAGSAGALASRRVRGRPGGRRASG